MSQIRGAYDEKMVVLTAYDGYRYSEAMALKVLKLLSIELPEHTFLNSISVKKGNQLTINGESEDPYQVRSHLQSLKPLTKVEFSGPVSPTRDKSKKKFTLVADIDFKGFQ